MRHYNFTFANFPTTVIFLNVGTVRVTANVIINFKFQPASYNIPFKLAGCH